MRDYDMAKKLIKTGNSLSIVIDKPILEMLKFNEDTHLEMDIRDGELIIRKAIPTKTRAEISRIMDDVMDKYAPVFEKLGKT